jgi:hypothetical protein
MLAAPPIIRELHKPCFYFLPLTWVQPMLGPLQGRLTSLQQPGGVQFSVHAKGLRTDPVRLATPSAPRGTAVSLRPLFGSVAEAPGRRTGPVGAGACFFTGTPASLRPLLGSEADPIGARAAPVPGWRCLVGLWLAKHWVPKRRASRATAAAVRVVDMLA